MAEVLRLLNRLKRSKKITQQQYRTYKGQVLSGDVDGCIRGLKRKEII